LIYVTIDEINDLAGAGRTTETVKGNADAITSHLAEFTNYGFGVRPYAASYNTLYIDEVNGNDNNDGLTQATAIKTASKLHSLIPIFLNQDFTIKIVGNFNATLGIISVFNSNSFILNSRKLILEGVTQNKGNHTILGARIIGCRTEVELRHIRAVGNAIACYNCTNVNLNNLDSNIENNSSAPFSAFSSNVKVENCSFQNNLGSLIVSIQGKVLSKNNSGSGKYGLNATSGGEIIKVGTQPTGTTSNEFITEGGVIR
jgi:hypothetical protein